MQPALEGARRVRRERPEDAHEDLLREVLRVVPVAGQAVGQPVHPGGVLLDDLLPGRGRPGRVALRRPRVRPARGRRASRRVRRPRAGTRPHRSLPRDATGAHPEGAGTFPRTCLPASRSSASRTRTPLSHSSPTRHRGTGSSGPTPPWHTTFPSVPEGSLRADHAVPRRASGGPHRPVRAGGAPARTTLVAVPPLGPRNGDRDQRTHARQLGVRRDVRRRGRRARPGTRPRRRARLPRRATGGGRRAARPGGERGRAVGGRGRHRRRRLGSLPAARNAPRRRPHHHRRRGGEPAGRPRGVRGGRHPAGPARA